MERLSLPKHLYRIPYLGRRVEQSGRLHRYLLKGATGSLALRGCSMVLLLLTSLVLARRLGTAGYGAYANANAWVNLLCIIATLGFPRLLLRQTSLYHANASWAPFRGLLRFSHLLVLATSLFLMACGGLVGWILFGSENESVMLHTLWVGLLVLPVIALMQLHQATISGFRHIILGQLTGRLFRPIIFLVFVVSAYLLFRLDLSAPIVMFLYLITAVIAFGTGVYWLFKVISRTTIRVPAEYKYGEWLKAALPLFFVAAMRVVMGKCDIIMLGAISGAESAGIYKVATRGAGLIEFSLFAVSRPFQPLIAGHYADGDKDKLQHVVVKWTRIAFIVALPLALFFMGWGEKFLGIFGPDFVKAELALSILAFAKLFDVGAGMVGALLTMSGHERESAVGIGLAALLSVFLNAVLIPKWGVAGAAIATSTSIVFWNLFLVFRVLKKMDIHTTILGDLRFGRSNTRS